MAGGVDLGDFGDEIVEKQARKRVGIVVEPQQVASWDHAKMAGPPGSGGGSGPSQTTPEPTQESTQEDTEAS